VEEEILEMLPEPDFRPVAIEKSPRPSLRYLELHLTHACNLSCRHCYLGAARANHLELPRAVSITRQFSEMGGLRLLISGGEPLLYPDLSAYIDKIRDFRIRRILFTNGTLLTREFFDDLAVDEIQFSLDGWQKGHDALRGSGAFQRTINGVHLALDAEIPVSFATMIHRGNLDEFDRMKAFMAETGALEWGIDILTVSGTLSRHQDLSVPCEEAAPLMEYAFGGGYHGSADGYACGRHLMAVMPDGQAVKCGFYRNEPLGDAASSLSGCWSRMPHIPLGDLVCAGCSVIEECRGGCRFRAKDRYAPDPAMCRLFGISR
jgi:radical SAM protein with 4Fe4S-binding SPASM domain